MSWQLTTPISVGDIDPAGNITHARLKMHENDPDEERIVMSINYGRIVDGAFVQAVVFPVGKASSYVISGEDYVTLVTTHTPNQGEKTYEAAKRGLYEFLNDHDIIPDGSLV